MAGFTRWVQKVAGVQRSLKSERVNRSQLKRHMLAGFAPVGHPIKTLSNPCARSSFYPTGAKCCSPLSLSFSLPPSLSLVYVFLSMSFFSFCSFFLSFFLSRSFVSFFSFSSCCSFFLSCCLFFFLADLAVTWCLMSFKKPLLMKFTHRRDESFDPFWGCQALVSHKDHRSQLPT